jgi:endonuclease/exonuclease/phosphatase family metal-dependent hydrolase
MLKILSWNCQYEWESKQGLSLNKMKEISLYDFDILIIQECTKKEFDAVKRNFRYRNWYCDDMEDSVLGSAIFSDKIEIEFNELFNRKFRYVIPYKIILKNAELNIFSIWIKEPFDGKQDYAKVLYDAIEYYKPKNKTIIIGDYNIGSNKEHIDRYQNLVDQLGKYDLINTAKNTKYEYLNTHWNQKAKNYYQNDFCFCSTDISIDSFSIPKDDQWVMIAGMYKWDKLSDHCPITVAFDI